MHARDLYLTFVGPLGNWRSDKYPQGINLFDAPRMRSFYHLPDSVMNLAGHVPNFGDCGPDNKQRFPSELPFSAHDIAFAEHLYAASSGPRKDDLGKSSRMREMLHLAVGTSNLLASSRGVHDFEACPGYLL